MKNKILLCLLYIGIVSCFTLTACSNGEGNENMFSGKLIVDCSEVIENYGHDDYGISEDKIEIVPENGIIFDNNISFSDGDTAHSVLIENLKKEKIHFEGDDGYIEAIANIYSGDCGDYSGWMFYINGELAETGASDTVINEGDVIEFRFVVDYMKLFE